MGVVLLASRVDSGPASVGAGVTGVCQARSEVSRNGDTLAPELSARPSTCDDHAMLHFVVKTLINAAAIGVATWVVKGITLTGASTGHKALTLILVALIFGVINWLIKPVVKLLALPLFILTLGLITFVINALMLELTSFVSGKAHLDFHVHGFGAALIGALIISVVAWALHLVMPDED
jgi:putative membrane protein